MTEPARPIASFDPFSGGQEPGGLRPYVVLDVFTDTPLQGNPLAVFTGGDGIDADTMQRVARELNLSETVFVLSPQRGGAARARIFTPAAELPFAGHPILGAAALVGSALGVEEVVLETAAADVPVSVRANGNGTVAGAFAPPLPTWEDFAEPGALLRALGLERSRLPIVAYTSGPTHVYVALPGERELAALRPDLGALGSLGAIGVNCFAGSGSRWRSRMFAPALGVAEDPATGSAAGPLAVHLCRHGEIPFGQEIEIRQGGEIGRPSLLRALARGTPQLLDSVSVGGSAVIIGAGRLAL